jgi:hypothetical protein
MINMQICFFVYLSMPNQLHKSHDGKQQHDRILEESGFTYSNVLAIHLPEGTDKTT